jgi:hypothetical protein
LYDLHLYLHKHIFNCIILCHPVISLLIMECVFLIIKVQSTVTIYICKHIFHVFLLKMLHVCTRVRRGQGGYMRKLYIEASVPLQQKII